MDEGIEKKIFCVCILLLLLYKKNINECGVIRKIQKK